MSAGAGRRRLNRVARARIGGAGFWGARPGKPREPGPQGAPGEVGLLVESVCLPPRVVRPPGYIK